MSQGAHGRAIGNANRSKVRRYLMMNPLATNIEVATGTGINITSVGRYRNELWLECVKKWNEEVRDV